MEILVNFLAYVTIQWFPILVPLLLLLLWYASWFRIAFPALHIWRWEQSALRRRVERLYKSIAPLPKIPIDRPLLRSIRRGKNVQGDIHKLLEALLCHAGLSIEPVIFHLQINSGMFTPGQKTIGSYRQMQGKHHINLVIARHNTVWNIAAMLCHEIAHYYAQVHGLRESDIYENERSTDILTVFLGFWPYIRRGYSVTRFRYDDIVLQRKRAGRGKIGYLPVHVLAYCGRYLTRLSRQARKETQSP